MISFSESRSVLNYSAVTAHDYPSLFATIRNCSYYSLFEFSRHPHLADLEHLVFPQAKKVGLLNLFTSELYVGL